MEDVKKQLNGDLPKLKDREKMMGGLGRIITDDFEFSESNLGSKIIDLSEKYVALPD